MLLTHHPKEWPKCHQRGLLGMPETAQNPTVPPGNVTGAVTVAEPPQWVMEKHPGTNPATTEPPTPEQSCKERPHSQWQRGDFCTETRKCEHHPVWFAGGHNPTRKGRPAPAAPAAPTLSSSPRVSQWPKGLRGGISLHHSPLLEGSKRFFPREGAGGVMESLAGVAINHPGLQAGGQRALGGLSRTRAAAADRASGWT